MKEGKHRLIYRVAKYCWHTSKLRLVYIYLNRKKYNIKLHIAFHKNIIFFKRYFLRNFRNSESIVASLPGLERLFANSIESLQGVFIDFGKIKAFDNVSVKLYEAGSLRIGSLSNKEQIGITLKEAAWENKPEIDDVSDKTVTRHDAVCLAICRVVTNSFALQLFDVFLAFIYLEYFRKRGIQVEVLLLDSRLDKLSTLYTVPLPACRVCEEFEGIHRFNGIVFLPSVLRDGWRTTLNTCDKAEMFHRFLLSAFGIPLPVVPVRRVKTMTLICRQKYITDGKKPCGDRVIRNEDEIIEILRNNYPRIEIRRVFLEKLPLSEQLELLACSDMLISMHGAGLILGAYCLPPNSGMIELFPKYYRTPEAVLTCRSIAKKRKIHYERWINHNHKNESGADTHTVWYKRYQRNPIYNHSVTRVPPPALLGKIDKLMKKIEGT